MSNDPDRGRVLYTVGYGRPPKQTQFKKGQSGNPRGRPRGRRTKTPAQIFEAAAFRQVSFVRDGRKAKASALELWMDAVFNRAISGKGSSKPILDLLRLLGPEAMSSNSEDEAGAREELQARLEGLRQRLLANSGSPKKPAP